MKQLQLSSDLPLGSSTEERWQVHLRATSNMIEQADRIINTRNVRIHDLKAGRFASSNSLKSLPGDGQDIPQDDSLQPLPQSRGRDHVSSLLWPRYHKSNKLAMSQEWHHNKHEGITKIKEVPS